MKRELMVGVLIASVTASGGYWLGQHSLSGTEAGTSTSGARKLLYYRNPMGLPDTSPTPKKDPMGMDYIAVYEGDEADNSNSTNQIKISTDRVQKLGVRVEIAEKRVLDKLVRAAGRIEPDERRTYAISPKFEGYIERLFVNVTGQTVSKGQPLFEVYSPELASAQREYAIAAQGAELLKNSGENAHDGMKALAESSLTRLRNWDISDEQIKSLAKSGQSKKTLTFRSPVSGVITEKKALQGSRFAPGDTLYQIADLSSVWVIADVFEQDIGLVQQGAVVQVAVDAYPDQKFEGKLAYVYPTLDSNTRTVAVRIELQNVGQRLKPGMFANVYLPAGGKTSVVTIPSSAVIDSGTRKIVLIQTGEGRFEPREVKLGQRSDNYFEVLEGVQEGESVVTSANFLIDAESNLKAAVGSFSHSSHGAKAVDTPTKASKTVGHKAEGSVDSVDIKAGSLTLNHGPVASLKWPSMTMEFVAANPSLLTGLKAGMPVQFEFVERKPGEWVVTSIQSKQAANPHAEH